ncbi:hypothetical protein LCGC14_0684580 [marine sediment metagenome]|uniref:Uncharacterized protein n=1 Tax=marine sediment metagenome TaxID=412755 RepID=A0A0F9QME3_9ZZZZ
MPRPQYGQQFQQLPAATRRDLTPETSLQQEIQTGRKQIDDKYKLMWDEIGRSAQFVGRQKAANMRQQLITKGKQEMLQFNQQAQQQLQQLQRTTMMSEQGLISSEDAARINASRVYGPDTAKSMYPTPEKGRTPAAVMSELSRYGEVIQSKLDRYKSVRIPEFWKGKAKEKRKWRIIDYSLPSKKEGEVGAYRDATKEEIQDRDFLLQEQKEIRSQEREIIVMPGIKHRVTQPGTTGGTFSDKVTESYISPVRRQPTRRIPEQPTAVELRKQGTREAYEKGKTLEYWN